MQKCHQTCNGLRHYCIEISLGREVRVLWVCGVTLGTLPHLFNKRPRRLTVEDPLGSETQALKQAYMCVEPWLHLGQVWWVFPVLVSPGSSKPSAQERGGSREGGELDRRKVDLSIGSCWQKEGSGSLLVFLSCNRQTQAICSLCRDIQLRLWPMLLVTRLVSGRRGSVVGAYDVCINYLMPWLSSPNIVAVLLFISFGLVPRSRLSELVLLLFLVKIIHCGHQPMLEDYCDLCLQHSQSIGGPTLYHNKQQKWWYITSEIGLWNTAPYVLSPLPLFLSHLLSLPLPLPCSPPCQFLGRNLASMKCTVLWVDSCWGIKDLGTNPSGGAFRPANEEQLEATALVSI